ncbi:MAG: oxygenase MpaB family protein [Vicinamibacterales bacterium]
MRSGRSPVAEKINREAIVVLGWGRAILLQIAHPLVAQGVAEHSPFGRGASDYARRAYGTIGAMLRLTFGTDAEAAATAARINAIHARVQGTLRHRAGRFPPGTPYAASDPALLLWVHATLVESLPLAYERFVGPLSPAEKDAYCVEAAEGAALLALPRQMAPPNVTALDSYMKEMITGGTIAVTPEARTLADALLRPPLGPASPLFGVARLATLGLLPPAIRDAYGYAWSARDERRFSRLCGAIRRLRGVAPRLVREWPMARRLRA